MIVLNRFLLSLMKISAYAGVFFGLAAIAGGLAAFGWLLYEYLGWIFVALLAVIAWVAWSIDYFRREWRLDD